MNKQTPEDRMKKIIFDNLDREKFKVFLFWSRAKWNYKYNSDYDIWIIGKEKIDYRKFLKTKRELDELPYLIDLVDFKKTDKDFKELALKNINIWN